MKGIMSMQVPLIEVMSILIIDVVIIIVGIYITYYIYNNILGSLNVTGLAAVYINFLNHVVLPIFTAIMVFILLGLLFV